MALYLFSTLFFFHQYRNPLITRIDNFVTQFLDRNLFCTMTLNRLKFGNKTKTMVSKSLEKKINQFCMDSAWMCVVYIVHKDFFNKWGSFMFSLVSRKIKHFSLNFQAHLILFSVGITYTQIFTL